jgi:hypothetical protein
MIALQTTIRCHGPMILPGVKDPTTGKSNIAGKTVMGFTNKGEEELRILDTIKSWKKPTIEMAAADAGATCKPLIKFESHDPTPFEKSMSDFSAEQISRHRDLGMNLRPRMEAS